MIFNRYYSQYMKIVKQRLFTGLFPKPTELDFLEKSPIILTYFLNSVPITHMPFVKSDDMIYLFFSM
jgi:hypothetical protein